MTDPRITSAVFRERFGRAVAAAVGVAATMVRPSLPSEHRFVIEPNASFDEHPLVDDQTVYPGDTLPARGVLGPLTFEDTVAWMWRDGKVPEWVDVAVCDAREGRTTIRLICCGRFSALESRLYYQGTGLAPFGIKSPPLPAGWASVAANGRFELRGCGLGISAPAT